MHLLWRFRRLRTDFGGSLSGRHGRSELRRGHTGRGIRGGHVGSGLRGRRVDSPSKEKQVEAVARDRFAPLDGVNALQ